MALAILCRCRTWIHSSTCLSSLSHFAVAQLLSYPGGCNLNRRTPVTARLAQSVERQTLTRRYLKAAGSTPAVGYWFCGIDPWYKSLAGIPLDLVNIGLCLHRKSFHQLPSLSHDSHSREERASKVCDNGAPSVNIGITGAGGTKTRH
ncbi:hypothetical protein C8Q74DRAFT_291854 [Fomes fomentarius]|nr:hypothetical protein C8Q74DRAFT_291854 [Fomes fomentarius]